MKRIRNLIESLKPDRLTPTASVFPEIDTKRIAMDLRLEEKAKRRGVQDLPASDDTLLDPVESEIVAELGRLRMAGLNQFEDHMETYARRLREASNSKAELRTVAGLAVTDYQTSVATWRNTISNARERVRDRFRERFWFMKDNRLKRTAHDRGRLWISLALAGTLIVLESAMNGYFFSASNVLGLLGGMSVAIVISLVNVGFSMIAGILARNVNHVKWLRKLIGLFVIALILAFSASFNLGVAHFRDAAGTMTWGDAVTAASANFFANPLGLSSFESWLLLFVGLLICVGAFWKGLAQDDPYPGYGHVHHRWEQARDEYAEDVREAIQELETLRDDAIEGMEEARKTLSSNINEAIDIVYARAGLTNQLGAFLDHTEQATNQLLAIYRDANRAARKAAVPRHFGEPHIYRAFQRSPVAGEPSKQAAENQIEEINAIVDETIRNIFQRYEQAIDSYESIEELERSALASVPRSPDKAG